MLNTSKTLRRDALDMVQTLITNHEYGRAATILRHLDALEKAEHTRHTLGRILSREARLRQEREDTLSTHIVAD